MRSTTRIAMGFTVAAVLLVSCSTAPVTQESQNELLEKATATMREMNRENPEVEAFAGKGTGYAVFPEVIKGGLVFGGAYGRGVVYERGQHIGYADMRQGSFGLQAGGQGREALDAAPLWADPRAHRETRVAPDVIGRTVRGGSKDEEPVDPGGVFLRSVLNSGMPRSTRMLSGVESKAVPC